jgi:hypothetical protein
MNYRVAIPSTLAEPLRRHLFRNEFEQSALLTAQRSFQPDSLLLTAQNCTTTPSNRWTHREEIYHGLRQTLYDHLATQSKDDLVICLSRPGTGTQVFFSDLDRSMINSIVAELTEDNQRPYIVVSLWGEESVDAIIWQPPYIEPNHV